jgi:ubiquinone/menaquinone biosynthesis C-methylase UbiE
LSPKKDQAMNTSIGKDELSEEIRRIEQARTSHWLFSRRGPAFLDKLLHIFEHPINLIEPYIQKGQVVTDLGCGWGQYSFALADLVGVEGMVFAIDLGKNCIASIQKKITKEGRDNIKAYTSSAAELGFIDDRSIDFVFANGLLCSMAYGRHLAVNEIKRILKPSGKAYLSLGMAPPFGYVNQAEWESIMQGFTVERGGSFKEMWAILSLHP